MKDIDNDSDEYSSEWDEQDFEGILSKPLAKYRWSLHNPKSDFGVALDLEIVKSKDWIYHSKKAPQGL